jgi:hypothetical protein
MMICIMMKSLRELADELGSRYGHTTHDALTTVTTYAAQLDVPGTGEGRRCPNVVVDTDTARDIRIAYATGVAHEEATR